MLVTCIPTWKLGIGPPQLSKTVKLNLMQLQEIAAYQPLNTDLIHGSGQVKTLDHKKKRKRGNRFTISL